MASAAHPRTEVNRADFVEKLAENLTVYDPGTFKTTPTGRRYSEPLMLSEQAPEELRKACKDKWGTKYLANRTHPELTYLVQLLSGPKHYNTPLSIRSVDTTIEAHPVDSKTDSGRKSWEYNREVIFRIGGYLWVIPKPVVVAEDGRLVYDINGEAKVQVVRGRVVGEESSIAGGRKVDGKLTDLFQILKAGGVLREHNVRLTGGYVDLDADPDYPNTASVRSDSGEGARYANADWPSYWNDRGLARLEVLQEA